MRLYTILKTVISIVSSKKNIIHTATKTASNKLASSITVVTLTNLPAGEYLVLGNITASIDVTNIIIANLQAVSKSTFTIKGTGRSTMVAGGGCNCWGLLNVTSNYGSVQLDTYGYYSGSCTYTGNILAIKLI